MNTLEKLGAITSLLLLGVLIWFIVERNKPPQKLVYPPVKISPKPTDASQQTQIPIQSQPPSSSSQQERYTLETLPLGKFYSHEWTIRAIKDEVYERVVVLFTTTPALPDIATMLDPNNFFVSASKTYAARLVIRCRGIQLEAFVEMSNSFGLGYEGEISNGLVKVGRNQPIQDYGWIPSIGRKSVFLPMSSALSVLTVGEAETVLIRFSDGFNIYKYKFLASGFAKARKFLICV